MSYTDQPAYAPQPGPYPPPQPKGSNGLAIAGLVLGLLGLLTCWAPVLNVLSIVLGVIGVVLSGIGLAKSKQANAGKGLSIAGIVLGALAIIFAVLINVALVSSIQDLGETSTTVEAPSDSGNGAKADGGGDSGGETGTTRSNPAPLGSAVTGGDWTVKINSVSTVNADSMGQKPAAGSTLLAVNMTATYKGNDEQGATPWATLKFVSPDGTTVDTTSGSTLFIAKNEFDSLKTVFNGGSVKGTQLFEVPADTWKDGVLAVSPDVMSDDTFVALK